MLFLGDPRGGGRGMLATLDVCLLLLLESLLGQIAREGGGSDLRCRLSPGFHQKVRIRSLWGHVSFLARVVTRSRIPLVPASIALVCGLVFVLP